MQIVGYKARQKDLFVFFVRDKETEMWISTRNVERTNVEGKQFDRNGVTGEIFRIEAISRRDVRKDASRGASRAGTRGNRNRISNLLRLIENTGVKCVSWPLGPTDRGSGTCRRRLDK